MTQYGVIKVCPSEALRKRLNVKQKTPNGVDETNLARRGVEGIRTPDEGFADPCLTTWPRRRFTACTLLLNFWEKNGNFGSTSISGNHAVFYKKLSGRWDSNPRPSPWQGDVLPLYYARILV